MCMYGLLCTHVRIPPAEAYAGQVVILLYEILSQLLNQYTELEDIFPFKIHLQYSMMTEPIFHFHDLKMQCFRNKMVLNAIHKFSYTEEKRFQHNCVLQIFAQRRCGSSEKKVWYRLGSSRIFQTEIKSAFNCPQHFHI